MAKRTCLRTARFGLGLLLLAHFCAAQLPPLKGAPRVGQKAPDFALPDSSGKPVKLADLLAEKSGQTAWVLLIFYRGYW